MMNLWKVSAVAAAAVAVAGCTQSESVDLSPCARAAAESSGIAPDSTKGGELHIYTWSDYLAPELIVGFEKALAESGATYTAELVTEDSNITTGEGPAAAMPYGYKLLSYYASADVVEALKEGMRFNHLMA